MVNNLKRILSIDFDIIMAPSIELYNDKVPGLSQEKLIEVFPILEYCQADMSHYQKLLSYLLEIVPKMSPDNIHIAFSHQTILKYIPKDEENHIVNIDHHHDLGYEEDLIEKKMDTCANWAKSLFLRNQIESYTWMNNSNSSKLPENIENRTKFKEKIHIRDFRDFDMSYPVPDILFICLSPEWVPLNYRPLFYSMLDVINTLTGRFYQLEEAENCE